MGDGDEFLLKWHDHHNSFFSLVEELVAREQLCDVTLSCGDVILNAHSLMLSVCSPYFRQLLSESQHREKHHIIHLTGVPGKLMQQLLVYMYRGEISIAQEDLGPLIETARCLQIKGLSLASSDIQDTELPRKRPASQLTVPLQLDISKTKERKICRKSPVKVGGGAGLDICNNDTQPNKLVIEEDEDVNEIADNSTEEPVKENKYCTQQIMLPLLPKPLSILKTAETRTYLSKLIWLGNGGKRPQYGNPETKPLWWPQHVLPWEEMKKMGGRKSQELSHINYTEILKQCLAAGYEYFGYDPSTYFCMDNSFGTSTSSHEEEDSQSNKMNGEEGDYLALDRSDTSGRGSEPNDVGVAESQHAALNGGGSLPSGGGGVLSLGGALPVGGGAALIIPGHPSLHTLQGSRVGPPLLQSPPSLTFTNQNSRINMGQGPGGIPGNQDSQESSIVCQ